MAINITRYAYLQGYSPIQVEESDGTLYEVHTAHLDTPKLLTNSDKAVVCLQERKGFFWVVVCRDVRFSGQHFYQGIPMHRLKEIQLREQIFLDYYGKTGDLLRAQKKQKEA